MPIYNPKNPEQAGDEWYASAPLQFAMGTTVGRGAAIFSTATESVDHIAALLRPASPPSFALLPLGVVDVYDFANPLADPISPVLAVPASNFSNSAGWQEWNGSVFTAYDSTAYTFVNSVIARNTPINTGASTQLCFGVPNPALVAQILFHAGNTFYDGVTGAGGASIASKRILRVTVSAVVENQSGHSVRFDGFLNIGGNRYSSSSGPVIIGIEQLLVKVAFTFDYDPSTLLPWSNTAAVNLTNGTDGFGIGVITQSGSGVFCVTNVNLVFDTTVERRVSTGFGSGDVTLDTWTSYEMADPLTHVATAWAKVTGDSYLLMFTQAGVSTPFSLLGVSPALTAGHAADRLESTDIATLPLVEGIPNNYGTVPGMFGALMLVGGVASVDSNPYVDVESFLVGSADLASVEQGVSTEGGGAYQSATIVVAVTPDGRGGALQDQPLSVSIDNGGPIAGPFDVQPTDVPADGQFHVITVRFAAGATPGGGTPVKIIAASSSVVPWRLFGLLSRTQSMSSADATSIVAAAAGIGGATDFGNADVTLDFPWSIGTVPAAPGSPVVAAANAANYPTSATRLQTTLPTSYNLAQLSWAATGLGAEFAYYEIQRQDSAGNWWPIAFGTDEGTAAYNDFESPRNVAVNYQIRVVRTDGSFSDWAAFAPVTITSAVCDIACMSNWLGGGIAFQDSNPTTGRQWIPNQTARGVIQPIYGRAMPVAFWPIEAGGDNFTRTLEIVINDSSVTPAGPVIPDRAIFDGIIELFQNRTLPYIAVCDGYGRVWYTSPAVQSMDRLEPQGEYSTTVLFTEVSDIPVPTNQ